MKKSAKVSGAAEGLRHKTQVVDWEMVKRLKPGNKRPSNYLKVYFTRKRKGAPRRNWSRTYWHKNDVPKWVKEQII